MLTTEKDKVSYAIGSNIGYNFKSQGIDVNADIVGQAIKDVLTGQQPALTDAQIDEVMAAFQEKMQQQAQAQQSQAGEGNRAAGKVFLEENKSQPGVTTLPSGLQYQVITAGSGPKPTLNDKVTTHYHGTLINGKVFDSSVQRGRPASFPVNGVIAGWTEALQLMPVGSKWKLFIPAELAYGERGAGADIGPGTTLVFDVELLSID